MGSEKGISYKSFWALNTGEAIVAGILRGHLGSKSEVLFPLNAQLKDIDLVLINLLTKKSLMIQVKESKAHKPKSYEVQKYGDGNNGWFSIAKDAILESGTDFFVFLAYIIEKRNSRITIIPHTLTIPTSELKSVVNRNLSTNKCQIYVWINPTTKKAIGTRGFKENDISLDKYLDENGLKNIKKALGASFK